jgi:hypothetical protein
MLEPDVHEANREGCIVKDEMGLSFKAAFDDGNTVTKALTRSAVTIEHCFSQARHVRVARDAGRCAEVKAACPSHVPYSARTVPLLTFTSTSFRPINI